MKKLILTIFTFCSLLATAQMQVDLPITFDDPNVGYDIVSFGGATDSILTDPTDPTNTVLRQIQPSGAQTWAGTTMGDTGLANPIPLTASNLTMTARIWSPNAGTPILLKVEDKDDPAIFIETQTNTTVAGGWQTLTFDFGNPGPNTLPFNASATYNKISIFCDFGNAAKSGETYYIDDVMMAGGGPAMTQVDLPITFDDPMTNYDLISFGGALDSILVDPTDPNNMVFRQTQPTGAQTWAGTTVGGSGLANAIPFTMGDEIMTVRVWSQASGIPILLKVEDATDPTISVETFDTTTVSGAWETLVFDFTNNAPNTPAIDYNATYDKVSVFCDFGNGAKSGEIYYIDDILFGMPAPAMTQVDLPITFDDPMTNYDLISFGGALDSILVDPTDPNNMVFRQTQPAGAQTWAGTTVGGSGLANAIPFTMGDEIMTVRVWSQSSGIPILLKVEDATDPTISVETFDTTTVSGAWETLVFDFTNNAPNTPAIDYNATYDKVSIFCDFGNGAKSGEIYYIDDVLFGMPAPPMTQVDLPITFEDAMTDYDLASFGGATDSIQVDPTDASNTVLRQTQTAGAQTWAGTTIGNGGLATAVPFSATETVISGRIWAVDSGIPVLLKVEDAADPNIFVEVTGETTINNGWSYIEWDMANSTPAIDLNNTYDKLSVFCDFGNNAKSGEVYYIDDIAFGSQIGLAENKLANFSIAPNPSAGTFTIYGNLQMVGNIDLAVINSQGQVVHQENVSTNKLAKTLNLDLADGVYFVKVSTSAGTQVQRLLISK